MARRQRFEVRHSVPFYALMAGAGTLAAILALYVGLSAPTSDAQGRPVSLGAMWAMIAVAILAMGFYVHRGITRIRNRDPVITVDKQGVTLRINKIWDIPWDSISRVEVRGMALRTRLDLQVDPEIHAAMRLPSFLFDDNFVSVRGKPFTIGVWSQGLDHSMRDAFESIRAWRPNLIKR